AEEYGCPIEASPAAPLISGMVLPAPGRARDVIEPLLEVTGQRLLVRDGVLTTRPLSRAVNAGFVENDLAKIDAPVIARRRSAAAERPARLALGHLDRARDYLGASAVAIRPGEGPMVQESVDMALDPAGARLAAERLLDGQAAAGDSVELALPPNRLALEPGDRIAVDGLAEGPFEITEIPDGLVRRITARALPTGDAAAPGVGRPPASQPWVALSAAPGRGAGRLPGSEPGGRTALAGHAKPWAGPLRVTDETSGAVLAEVNRPVFMGEV